MKQKNNRRIKRCAWVGNNPLYVKYHDREWGVPVYDDDKLFEFLVLEIFQAGLSWLTILKKRENFRKAFDNFDYKKIVLYGDEKYEELLQNKGIIRNKLKIKAIIFNAKEFMKIQNEFGSFSNYIWGFINNKPIVNKFKTMDEIPTKTELAEKIGKDLRKHGFKFIGPTIIYAHMQATGMINDHTTDCFRYKEINDLIS